LRVGCAICLLRSSSHPICRQAHPCAGSTFCSETAKNLSTVLYLLLSEIRSISAVFGRNPYRGALFGEGTHNFVTRRGQI
jgi:hypothetical protein